MHKWDWQKKWHLDSRSCTCIKRLWMLKFTLLKRNISSNQATKKTSLNHSLIFSFVVITDIWSSKWKLLHFSAWCKLLQMMCWLSPMMHHCTTLLYSPHWIPDLLHKTSVLCSSSYLVVIVASLWWWVEGDWLGGAARSGYTILWSGGRLRQEVRFLFHQDGSQVLTECPHAVCARRKTRTRD